MSPVFWQRFEAGATAALVLIYSSVTSTSWWWIFGLFLVFDLSMMGYLRSTRAGAITYNAVHSYLGPSLLLGWVLLASTASNGVNAASIEFSTKIALAWVFHIAVDRALGYGLKLPDSFEHTHLGWIGRKARGEASPE